MISADRDTKRSSAFKGVERRHGPSYTLNYKNQEMEHKLDGIDA